MDFENFPPSSLGIFEENRTYNVYFKLPFKFLFVSRDIAIKANGNY